MRIVSLAATVFIVSFAIAPAARAIDSGLAAAVASTARSPKFVARDAFRHPAEELEFFGIKPEMAVVEIWPEGGYWTEILASYLHDRGTYYVADPFPNYMAPTKAMFDKNAALYGNVKVGAFGKGRADIALPGRWI